jgi:hypothetical protein
LPIWLLTGKDLDQLRTDAPTGVRALRTYIHSTGKWLHLLYRDEEPYGYVHGHQRRKDKHTVLNVSITREAQLIRRAIDAIDEVSPETARAVILECPKAGLAGILVFPQTRKAEPLICLYRDPGVVIDDTTPAPITARVFLERLLQAHLVRGPNDDTGSSSKPRGAERGTSGGNT